MKTAFSSFIYSRRGIYGILHILILLMSLFLVISISIDTFHNIPFLNQGSYLKIQFWICMFFLFDFLLEFFLSKEKGRYFTSHFIFLLVSIPYLNIIDFYHITFSPEISYFLRFIPLLRGGYALAIVVGWLSGSKASGLFTSYITMLMATVYFASLIFFVLEHKVEPYGDGLLECAVVGVYGCHYRREQYLCRHSYGENTVGGAGRPGNDDVPHFHGIRHQSGAAGQQAEGGILSIATIGAGGY